MTTLAEQLTASIDRQGCLSDLQSQADISCTEFNELDEQGHTTVKLMLDECRFVDAELARLHWTDSRIREVLFQRGSLANATWIGGVLSYTEYVRVRLTGTAFPESKLTACRFHHSKCDLTVFHDATLTNCQFEHCDLQEADFQNARLSSVTFRNCNLRKARFPAATLQVVDFRGSDLQSVTLAPDQLSGCSIDHSQLLDLAAICGVTVSSVADDSPDVPRS